MIEEYKEPKKMRLKKCPFCGCKMSSNDTYAVIFGNHSQNCFFYMTDHQNDFDFYNNKEHKKLLFEAWNSRESD